MNELVQRLSQGDHPIEAGLRPEKTAMALKDCIDRGYVHIKFTNTQGGTELGVTLDPSACDLTQANFDRASGTIQLVGGLTLNYVPVKCIATLNLHTLAGQGHLETISEPVTVP